MSVNNNGKCKKCMNGAGGEKWEKSLLVANFNLFNAKHKG